MSDISEIAKLYVSIGANMQDFKKGMESVSTKMQGFGKKMSAAGGTLTKSVTAPLVGLGTAAVMTVAKFDDSMSKVQAISGATGDELDSLRDLAKDLGSTTAFSASQAADAMQYLALAGWETNQILDATPQMLALASAGAMELSQAADIVSDTMSAFGMEAEDAGRAADIFAAASSKSNTDVQMLGEAMKYAAPVANSFGASLEDTSAIAGRMADSGIKASQAGTALRAGFLRLASPTEDAAGALHELGVETTTSDGSMRDIIDIMYDMESGMEGMSEEAKISAMQSIFGTNAMAGWMAVMDGGIDSLKGLSDELYDSSGAAQDMADTMQDNVGGAFRALKSQAEGIMIQLGEQLVPIIREQVVPLLQQFGDRISSLIDWFTTLNPEQQKMIGIAAGIAAALGPVLIVIGKVIAVIGTLLPVIAAIASPVGIVVLAIAGLVAAFVYLWRTNEEFREGVTAIWGLIKASAEQIWGALKESVSVIMESLQLTITAIAGSIRTFWETWGETILLVATTIWNQIALVIETAIGLIAGVINTVLAVIRGDWEGAWEALKGIGETIWGLIEGSVRNIVELVGGLFGGLADTIKTLWTKATTTIGDGIESIITFFKELPVRVMKHVGQLAKDVLEKTADLWRDAKKAFNDGIESIVEWFKRLPARVMAHVGKLAKDVLGSFGGLFKQLVGNSVVPDMMNAIDREFKKGMDIAAEKVETSTKKMGSDFATMAGDMIDEAALMADAIKTGLGQITSDLDLAKRTHQAEYALMRAEMDDTGGAMEGLKLKSKELRGEYDIQVQRVDAVKAAYEKMREEKGENAEETRKLYIEYVEETTKLRGLETAVGDTEIAMKDLRTERTNNIAALEDELSALTDTRTEQEKLKDEAVALKTAIEQQEQSVKNAQGAHIDFASALGSASGKSQEAYEKYLQESIALANLKKAYEDVSRAVDGVTGAKERANKVPDPSVQNAATGSITVPDDDSRQGDTDAGGFSLSELRGWVPTGDKIDRADIDTEGLGRSAITNVNSIFDRIKGVWANLAGGFMDFLERGNSEAAATRWFDLSRSVGQATELLSRYWPDHPFHNEGLIASSFRVAGYDNGGVVPGPRGMPQMAMVHGGETILPTHKGDYGGISVTVTGNHISSDYDIDRIGERLVNKIRSKQGVRF